MRTAAMFVLLALEDVLELVMRSRREVAFRKFLAAHPDVIVHEISPRPPA